jgi:hypothetical protein
MSDRGRIPKGLVPGQGAAPTRPPAKRPSQEPELIYWGNQYGHGIVLKGDLARRVAIACSITGETPEEFVMKAIDKKIND